jgi:RHS repeat-associated protein
MAGWAGWRGTGGRARLMARARLVTAVTVSVGLVAGLLTASAGPAAGAAAAARPRLPRVPAAKGLGHLGVHRVRVRDETAARARPSGVRWPAAESGVARLNMPELTPAGNRTSLGAPMWSAAGGPAGVAGTPVWAQAAGAAAHQATAVAVRVLSHKSATAVGVKGVVFTAAAPGGAGSTRIGVDYAGFADAFGGNYALSLGLVELPACALTTPQRAACRRQSPLRSVNDAASRSVSAQVSLPAAATSAAGSSSAATARAASQNASDGSAIVLAAAPVSTDGGGPAGTYSATSLKPSGTWAAGGSDGSFTYSYPITVPPAVSSLEPSVSLDYDSGEIDGQTASTQAQASWAGDGWQTPQAYIAQTFIPCQDDPEGSAAPESTQDDCYDGPVLTLSLNGSSTPLVCPVPFSYTSDSTCTPSDDDGAVVTHIVGSGNGSGTKFTDYWTVTERDGTTYYFGRNELPGWSSDDQATDSVDTVPVFSAHPGDPCYSSSGFTSSVCTMADQWNLDYVTDLHGDAMAYYYDQATNAYAEYGTSAAVPYTRDSYLARIDYGFTSGNAYSGSAPDDVVFGTGDRCFTGPCDPLSSATAANWLDVPYADYCAAGSTTCSNTGPTFWSTVRLTSITTRQWNGSAYVPVDSWALDESFPPTGDETSPTLFLDSITHIGSDTTAGGSAVTLPAVSFIGEDLGNRLNPGNEPALDRYRIEEITTETGEQILVSYEQVDPCSASAPPTPSANTESCFPVYWQVFAPPTPDWFVKYAVKSVDEVDTTGGSPGVYTSYKYADPAWHYDDNELVQPKYRTYGQWRGYEDVKTFTGTGTDAQTESESTYYQGMSDDNDSTAVNLTDSQGGSHADVDQLAGDVLEHTDYDFAGGPVEDSQIYSYWVSAAAATRTRTGLPALTANVTGQVEEWTRTAITDTGTTTWRDTETDTSYDATSTDADFGLPRYVYAHGDLSQPSQQTCTTTTYAAPNTSENLVGLVAETEVDAAACGGPNPDGSSTPTSGEVNALTAPASISRPADVISDSRTFYDDPPVLSGGVALPSNATWPQAAPGNADTSVVQQASGYTGGAFTYQTTSATAYDSYGRPVTSYDGNGNATTTAYTTTSGVTTAQKVTNALGQSTTTTYDPLRGLPLTVTDPNGITTTLHYNGLGVLTDVWEYGRPTSDPANYIYGYDLSNSAPTLVTTQQLNDDSGYITSTTLYDALLRQRQTQVPTPQGGILISDDFYDSRGWLYKVNTNTWDASASPSQPACQTTSPPDCIVTVPDSQATDQTVTAFDGLGRPVLVTSYDDSAVKSITATAYYGDRVTTVPDMGGTPTSPVPGGGTPTSTVTDALGRTTEIDDYTSPPAVTTSVANDITTVSITGGATQATTYSYNTVGELSDISSAGENWTAKYNLLGQVTSQADPDAGSTSMAYDADGNVTSATDADGHTVSYTYDALNRETGEYDGPNSGSSPIATWAYDNSNDAVPGMSDPIGQLTTETSYDSAGHAYTLQQNGFNAFGESLGETWTIPSTQGALAGTYALTSTYTATTGLPHTTTYPALPGGGELPGETVEYGYVPGFDLPNTVGSNLAGYDQGTTYDALSQVTQQEVGSVASHAYVTDSYDPHTGNLTDSQVANTSVSSTPYDDTSYTYDPSGNITSQTDVQDANPATSSTSQSETQCYDYDTLDQLVQAWTATDDCAANPASNDGATVGDGITGSEYWTSWSFNPDGEPATQTQHSLSGGQGITTSYAYSTTQPNALASTTTTGPSAATTASYRYDADGNTTVRDLPSGNQSLTWAADGSLASDTTSAGTTSYVYDADGNVLLQEDPDQVTLYIFGEQIVLHAAPGSATGTITGTRFLSLPGGGQVVRTGAGGNYSFELTNQQGTAVITLNNDAQNPAWQQYTPYGATRGAPPASWPDTNGFLGDPTDADTGLTIVGARQYDPSTGMFLSLDPLLEIGSPQQLNGYTYAGDNPVTNADPSGLMEDAMIGGGCISDCPGDNSSGGGDSASATGSFGPNCTMWDGCQESLLTIGAVVNVGAQMIDGTARAATNFSGVPLDPNLSGHWSNWWERFTGTQAWDPVLQAETEVFNIFLIFVPFLDLEDAMGALADALDALKPDISDPFPDPVDPEGPTPGADAPSASPPAESAPSASPPADTNPPASPPDTGPPAMASGGPAAASGARFAVDPQGTATDLGARASADRPVVIGEAMQARVVPAAQKLAADWYQPPDFPNNAQSLTHNRYWINEMMNQGRGVIDIGAAPGRSNFPAATSPWYAMEQDQVAQRAYPYYMRYSWDW